MKSLVLTFIMTLSFSAMAQSHKYKFIYKSFDGQIIKNCTYKPINEWYDYEVKCDEKVFSVHLLVRSYTRQLTPKTTIEVLYWINNKTVPNRIEGSGSSIWFDLTEKTAFEAITVSQSTDQDTAGLYLYIKPY